MKIVLIGSGNVATHLGKALMLHGHEIAQVYSRSLGHAQDLCGLLADGKPEAIDRLEDLNTGADLYFICVSDRAIAPVLAALPTHLRGIVVHTSGSTPMEVFGAYAGAHGVFYPVQTFSKAKEVDFKEIPLALEASDPATFAVLEGLATQLSNRYFPCDSTQRQAIHVAAIFACNFSNYLFSLGEQVLLKNGLDFDLIRPLIQETADKIQQHSPSTVQTGPASRGDMAIVERHLEFLSRDSTADPRIKTLYALMSSLIAGKPL